MSGIDLEDLKVRLNAVISALENRFFSDDSCRRILREHFHVEHLEALGLADYETGAIAAGSSRDVESQGRESKQRAAKNLDLGT